MKKNDSELFEKMHIAGKLAARTLDELTSFINGCKTMLGKTAIKVGDKVWVVQKTKRTKGVVTKTNIKKAIVSMETLYGTRSYNVPFSMIELA